MVSPRPSSRVAGPAFLLAIALIVGSAAPTIARDAVPTPSGVSGRSADPAVPAVQTAATSSAVDPTARGGWRRFESILPTEPAATPAPEVRTPVAVPEAKPHTVSTSTSTGSSGDTTSSASFRGRNHVWIPALGIDRSVAGFACSSQAYPWESGLSVGLRRRQQRVPVRPRP